MTPAGRLDRTRNVSPAASHRGPQRGDRTFSRWAREGHPSDFNFSTAEDGRPAIAGDVFCSRRLLDRGEGASAAACSQVHASKERPSRISWCGVGIQAVRFRLLGALAAKCPLLISKASRIFRTALRSAGGSCSTLLRRLKRRAEPGDVGWRISFRPRSSSADTRRARARSTSNAPGGCALSFS